MSSTLKSLLVCALLVSGCAGRTPLVGREGQQTEVRPIVEAIIADLRAQSKTLVQFRASGRFVLKAPELEAAQVLRQSSINFEAPDKLHVVGRKYSKVVFRLVSAGNAFLLEFPTEQQYIYSDSGAPTGDAAFRVSPAAIAEEMFIAVPWDELGPEMVSLLRDDSTAGTATIEVKPPRRKGELTRRLQLQGPPWVVTQSEVFNAEGDLQATTTRSGHRDISGVLFPAQVEARFPVQDAFMSFDLGTLTPGEKASPGLFDVEAALREMERKGYARVERVTANLEETTQ